MRLFADEHISREIVTELRNIGHDVEWAQETGPGASDEAALALANAGKRIVLTRDRDFGELTIAQRLPAVGVAYIRLREFKGSVSQVGLAVAQLLTWRATELAGNLTVVEPNRVRARTLPNPISPD